MSDEVELALYVDDFTISTRGDPLEAARKCAAVVDLVTRRIRELGLTVSEMNLL